MTIGGQTFPLPELFLVLATQNPIEHEGTYPLPEAQVDRFMFKLVVTYPERREEREVLDRMTAADEPAARPVLDPERILRARRLVQRVYADDRIKEYVLDLVAATRRPADAGLAGLAPLIEFGASPRAAIFLLRAAKAHAFLAGSRLRHPRRHQGARPRRAAPPGDPHLPRRCRRDGTRTRCCAASSRRCRCHESGGGHARGAAPGDHHPPPRARHHGRASTPARSAAAGSSSPRSASTSRATTSAPSTGTSPPGSARPT